MAEKRPSKPPHGRLWIMTRTSNDQICLRVQVRTDGAGGVVSVALCFGVSDYDPKAASLTGLGRICGSASARGLMLTSMSCVYLYRLMESRLDLAAALRP